MVLRLKLLQKLLTKSKCIYSVYTVRGFGPFFLFGFLSNTFVVMVYAVAVGAQHNALFDFFHGTFKCTVLYQLVDRGFFGIAVCVVEVKRGGVVLPTFNAS